MLSAAISCDRSSVTSGARCEPLYLNLANAAELLEAAAKALGAAGWTEKGGEHFCPRHDPADVGETLEVGFQYTPIPGTGWEVRVPPSEFSAMGLDVTWRLEIRRTSVTAAMPTPGEQCCG